MMIPRFSGLEIERVTQQNQKYNLVVRPTGEDAEKFQALTDADGKIELVSQPVQFTKTDSLNGQKVSREQKPLLKQLYAALEQSDEFQSTGPEENLVVEKPAKPPTLRELLAEIKADHQQSRAHLSKGKKALLFTIGALLLPITLPAALLAFTGLGILKLNSVLVYKLAGSPQAPAESVETAEAKADQPEAVPGSEASAGAEPKATEEQA